MHQKYTKIQNIQKYTRNTIIIHINTYTQKIHQKNIHKNKKKQKYTKESKIYKKQNKYKIHPKNIFKKYKYITRHNFKI